MHAAILTFKNTKLTPEARWLVMQWAAIIGLDQSAKYTLKDLFARLGLTKAQGHRAWDVLTSKKGKNKEQFVEIERLPSKGPGRPASRYRLSEKLVKALKASPSIACEHHAEEIASLAKTTRLPAANDDIDLLFDRRSSGLTLPNRWLFMVLLAHADAPGIITGLSIAAMRRLTGMTRYRITNQLKKLSNLGLIAHHQPGQYEPHASARKTSIYLLDLSHSLIGSSSRKSITTLWPSSSAKPKKTEIVDGVIDAVMTAGICSLQIETLVKKYVAIELSRSNSSNDTNEKPLLGVDPYVEAKAYQAKIDKINKVMQCALSLLPSTRYLEDGIAMLLQTYNNDDANKLLASVHADAMLLLSTCWLKLKEGRIGPDQPQPDIIAGAARRLGFILEDESNESLADEAKAGTEENRHGSHIEDEKKSVRPTEEEPTTKQISYSPLAILFYALSHHLAKRLQGAFEHHGDIDFEAMTYILVPVYSGNTDERHLPIYELRGYGLKTEDIKKNKQKVIFFQDPVDEDLKTYWRTHHKDCLSASIDEPEDEAKESPEPANQ